MLIQAVEVEIALPRARLEVSVPSDDRDLGTVTFSTPQHDHTELLEAIRHAHALVVGAVRILSPFISEAEAEMLENNVRSPLVQFAVAFGQLCLRETERNLAWYGSRRRERERAFDERERAFDGGVEVGEAHGRKLARRALRRLTAAAVQQCHLP